jgi:hypothetical protein
MKLMEKKELYRILEKVTAGRKSREAASTYFLGDEKNIKELIGLVFEINDPVAVRASWVLDIVAGNDLAMIFPHLDIFIKGLGTVQNESVMRPLARITEKILTALDSGNDALPANFPDENQHELLLAAAFKWLIGPHKTATKVFAMRCLYFLGKSAPWVHDELCGILKQQYADGSSGYKARARDTLKRLEVHGRHGEG